MIDKDSYDKRKIAMMVKKKLDQKGINIPKLKVFNVVNFLFEEIFNDLDTNKRVRIKHFCYFQMKPPYLKMLRNKFKNFEYTEGEMRSRLVISFSHRIRDYLIRRLDVDKTFRKP